MDLYRAQMEQSLDRLGDYLKTVTDRSTTTSPDTTDDRTR
jgi:hypothetical protein